MVCVRQMQEGVARETAGMIIAHDRTHSASHEANQQYRTPTDTVSRVIRLSSHSPIRRWNVIVPISALDGLHSAVPEQLFASMRGAPTRKGASRNRMIKAVHCDRIVASTPRRNPSAAREIAEIGDNKLAH